MQEKKCIRGHTNYLLQLENPKAKPDKQSDHSGKDFKSKKIIKDIGFRSAGVQENNRGYYKNIILTNHGTLCKGLHGEQQEEQEYGQDFFHISTERRISHPYQQRQATGSYYRTDPYWFYGCTA